MSSNAILEIYSKSIAIMSGILEKPLLIRPKPILKERNIISEHQFGYNTPGGYGSSDDKNVF